MVCRTTLRYRDDRKSLHLKEAFGTDVTVVRDGSLSLIAGQPEVALCPNAPISSLSLQSATNGKTLVPSRGMQLGKGIEGLCSSINAAGNTVIVGCNRGRLVCVDAHTMSIMDTIHLPGDGQADGLSTMSSEPPPPRGGSAVPDLVPSCTSVRYMPFSEGTSSAVVVVAQGTRVHHVHVSTGKVLRTQDEGPNKVRARAGGREGVRLQESLC